MKKRIAIISGVWFVFLLAVIAYSQTYYFTNFSAGIISRKLDSRLDFPKMLNGAKTVENMIVYPQGGVTKRPGFKYVAAVSDSSKMSRLIPFIYSTTDNYILEFCNEKIYFFRNQGQILSGGAPYSIDSPYADTDLKDLQYTQSADVLYLAHPDYAPRKLVRTGHTSWDIIQIAFLPPPLRPSRSYPSATLTPGSTTGEVTFTGSATNTFFQGDRDREIVTTTGRALITDFNNYASPSGSEVTALITNSFPNTATIAANSWWLEGSPNAKLTAAAAPPLRIGINMQYTSDLNAFRSSDVGKFISTTGNGGVMRIDTYSNASYVQGVLLSPIESGATTVVWQMGENAFNTTDKYPSVVEFYEDRLVWGSTQGEPQTLWFSVTGDYENYAIGPDDDDSIKATLSSNQVNRIRWLNASRSLTIGTTGSEWTMGSYTSTSPITPSNIQAKKQTSVGSAAMDSMTIDKDIVFVDDTRKKLRSYSYDFDIDGFKSNDLTILSDELTEDATISEITYQQEPNSIAWSLLSDGDLLGLTYVPGQNIGAWHKHTTSGDFESIAVIPGPNNNDELWAVIKKTVSSGVTKWICYMEKPEQDTNADAFYVDAGLTGTSSGSTTWSNLDHLSGLTVTVNADGVDVGDHYVTGGEIYLSAPATKVTVGLKYTATLETIELPAKPFMDAKRIKHLLTRFYKTSHAQFGSSSSDMDTVDFSLESGATPYTGQVRLNYPGGWEIDNVVRFSSDAPLPMAISGVVVSYE